MLKRNRSNRTVGMVESLEARQLLAASPALFRSFDAIDAEKAGQQSGFIAYPSDPSAAAGPSQVLSVVNNSIEWYGKTGSAQNSESIRKFFSSLGPAVDPFDPKALYDQYSGRFIVMALDVNASTHASRIMLAVSKSSDANGGWYFQAINSKMTIDGFDRWADYAGISTDGSAVYITANMDPFDPSASYVGSRLFIVPKSSFYGGGAITAKVYDTMSALDLTEQNNMQPTQMFGSTPAGVGTFLVYSYVFGDYGDYIGVIRVNNPLGTPTFSQQFVSMGDVSSVLALGNAPQLGSPVQLETYEPFALNAVWRNNNLYVASTVNPPAGVDAGQSTVHWTRINTGNLAALAVADQGNVSGEDIAPGTHTFYPNLAVDASGNMAIGFGASGSRIHPGAYYAARMAGDAAGTIRAAVPLAVGQAAFGSTSVASVARWGEYSGMALDPDGNTFWVYNQYAQPAGSTNEEWGTRIGAFSFGNTPPPQPPPPATQSPFNGVASAVPGTIQAENFDNGGEGISYHDSDANNQSGQYRLTGVDIEASMDTGRGYDLSFNKAGEWLEYTVNVASSGNYDFGLRAAASGAGGSVHFEVDGVDVTGSMNIPNTGGWQTWQTVTKSGVALTAGQHVLRLSLDTAGSAGYLGNINWISLTKSGAPVTGQTPFKGTPFALPTTIQLEDFDNGGEGVAWHDSDTTNQGGQYRSTGVDIEKTADTGGGYDLSFAKPGEWLEYSVNVASAGSYTLDLRSAYGGTLATGGTAHVEMDGIDITGAMTLPKTGGWQNWQTVSKSGVTLTAGSHVLRLVFDKDGAGGTTGYMANMNWMQIRSGAVTVGNGLTGQYFSDANLTNLAFTRVDAYVNLNLASGAKVDSRLPATNWSARWTGKVIPRYSETYTFRTLSDDGVRLWVNGQLLIDNWTGHPSTLNTATIALQAGVKYDIKLEYCQLIGAGQIVLGWQSAHQSLEVIPTSQLYSA